MSVGSFWAYAPKKLLDAKGHLEGPAEMQGITRKATHQGRVRRQNLLLALLVAAPKKAQGMTLGLARGNQNTKPQPSLASVAQWSPPGRGRFPTVHSPTSLNAGVPGNLPLPHRGPFLVRALGPLSVPETKTSPLWPPSHLERPSPHTISAQSPASGSNALLSAPLPHPGSHTSSGFFSSSFLPVLTPSIAPY